MPWADGLVFPSALQRESCPAALPTALQGLAPEGDAEGANIRELSEDESLEQLGRKERTQVLRQVTHHPLEQNRALILHCPALSRFLDDERERQAGIKCYCWDAGQSLSTVHYCK